MKGIVYRSAALALALVVVCSALVVPSFATDYQSTYNFWNWAYDNSWFLGKAIIGFAAGNVCQVSEDGMHHATTHSSGFAGGGRDGERVYNCVCDFCGQEFQAVATDLEQTYNTNVEDTNIHSVNSSGAISYCNWEWPDVIGSASKTAQGFNYVTYYYSGGQSTTFSACAYFTVDVQQRVYITVPYSYMSSLREEYGYVTSEDVGCYNQTSKKDLTLNRDDVGYYFSAEPNNNYMVWCRFSNSGALINLTGLYETFYINYPDILLHYTGDTLVRPSVFAPSFSYTDESGGVVVSDNQIVDETNLTYYNPVTNTTTNIQNWSYDYSDRSYTVLTDSNNTTTITYGDEYITINEGDNITYNIYYYTEPDSSGDGSGGSGDNSDDGDGIGGGLGELLGSLLGGLIDLITGLISGLIDSLINLVEVTIEKLGQVVNLFGEFGDALKVLWSWLPDEIVTILAAGVSVVVFASVIKLFV